MFKLTLDKQAKGLLDAHFLENPKPEFLRLYVRPRKSGKGSRLALKPDVMGERDFVAEDNGYSILISRHLLQQIGAWAKIGANDKGGFDIIAEKNFTPD